MGKPLCVAWYGGAGVFGDDPDPVVEVDKVFDRWV